MDMIYAIPRNNFPAGWDGEESFSDIRFFREVKPFAISIPVDLDDPKNEDMLYVDFEEGHCPLTLKEWAASRGESEEDYLFILPRDTSDQESTSTEWPKELYNTFSSWPNAYNYCIEVAMLKARSRRAQEEWEKVSARLARLIEVDGI